jgi:surface antigen
VRAARRCLVVALHGVAIATTVTPPVGTSAAPAPSGAEYRGYGGRMWVQDFGVLAGRCETAAVLGSPAASGSARGDDLVAGVYLGAVVGGAIGMLAGRELDRADRGCIGQALELAPSGRTVNWTNSTTRVAYTLTVVRDLRGGCRQFRLVARRGGKEQSATQLACTSGDGRWQPS